MAHARVNPFLDGAPQIAQRPAQLVHARERNVRVHVAAAEKYRRAFQRSCVGSRSPIRADESRRSIRSRRRSARRSWQRIRGRGSRLARIRAARSLTMGSRPSPNRAPCRRSPARPTTATARCVRAAPETNADTSCVRQPAARNTQSRDRRTPRPATGYRRPTRRARAAGSSPLSPATARRRRGRWALPGAARARQRRVPPNHDPAPGRRTGGNRRSRSARRGSSQGGSLSDVPRRSSCSSTAKPGGSVAISNKIPPGSRK